METMGAVNKCRSAMLTNCLSTVGTWCHRGIAEALLHSLHVGLPLPPTLPINQAYLHFHHGYQSHWKMLPSECVSVCALVCCGVDSAYELDKSYFGYMLYFCVFCQFLIKQLQIMLQIWTMLKTYRQQSFSDAHTPKQTVSMMHISGVKYKWDKLQRNCMMGNFDHSLSKSATGYFTHSDSFIESLFR